MRIINKYWLPVLLAFSFGCSSPENEHNENSYAIEEIHVEVFLSAETDAFVGRPGRIIADNEKLYYSDHALQHIIGVDMDGEIILSFGSQGNGPGEFSSLASFWLFDEGYMVYDYNRFKFINYNLEGEVIGEIIVEKNPVNPDGFPTNIPMTTEAISPERLVIPSRGLNGSLFAIADIQSNELVFVGEAIGRHVESYNEDEVQREFYDGAIPAIFLNMVLLSTRSSAIYSFQQTTGLLEKYNYSGDLIWEKSIQPEVQMGLFEEIALANQNLDTETESHQLFNYAHAIDANEKGVAILLNVPEGEPVTVAWIPEDGSKVHLVSLLGLNQDEHNRFGTFTVSSDNRWIYFLNMMDGIIARAEWQF